MSRLSRVLMVLALVAVVGGLGTLAWMARQGAQSVGVTVGNPAPTFSLTSLKGRTISLASLKGEPVYLNFFTSFCQACRDEAPSLASLQQHYGNRAHIVGVDLTVSEPSLTAVRQFRQTFGVAYPIAMDKTGSISDLYGVSSLPVSVFIGPNGHVRSVVTEVMSYNQMVAQLKPLLSAHS